MEVLFFQNGSTAVFKDNKQQSELQESWILLYAKFLEENGVDPTKAIYKIKFHGTIATVEIFRTKIGNYSWRIKN